MKIFEFSDKMLLGLKPIDEHHRKLVESLVELMTAMKEGKGEPVVAKLLKKLISYASYHFAKEEDLMKRHQYPDFESHRKAHEIFREKVGAFEDQFVDGDRNIAVHLGNYLCDWLVNHIMGLDKKLAVFLVHVEK